MYVRQKCIKIFRLSRIDKSLNRREKEVKRMEIDKLQLFILSILEETNSTTPGTGMTLREIADEVNEADHKYAQATINKKVWSLRKLEYVASKLKTNKADMFYITAKGKQIKEVLLHEE